MEFANSTNQDSAITGLTRSSRYRVPATGGEFWQGVINHQLLLVNCPIDFYGEIEVINRQVNGIISVPAGNELLQQAVREVQKVLQLTKAIDVVVHKPVPRGLGMASSTTEIAALIYSLATNAGLAAAAARSLTHTIVTKVDYGVDGNYLQGINLVNPVTGKPILQLPSVPKLKMLLVNTGGQVATKDMDREKEKYVNRQREDQVTRSYQKIMKGFMSNNLRLIGEGATISSQIYQDILPKPKFARLLKYVDGRSILGLTTGHSGTIVGLLAPLHFALGNLKKDLENLFGQQAIIGEHNIVSGGIYGC